jgi:hypothetical protein
MVDHALDVGGASEADVVLKRNLEQRSLTRGRVQGASVGVFIGALVMALLLVAI